MHTPMKTLPAFHDSYFHWQPFSVDIVKVSNLFIHATVDFTVCLFLFLSFSGCSKQSIR